jgi:hypothetical protein
MNAGELMACSSIKMKGGGVPQVAEWLPSKRRALRSNPSAANEQITKRSAYIKSTFLKKQVLQIKKKKIEGRGRIALP